MSLTLVEVSLDAYHACLEHVMFHQVRSYINFILHLILAKKIGAICNANFFVYVFQGQEMMGLLFGQCLQLDDGTNDRVIRFHASKVSTSTLHISTNLSKHVSVAFGQTEI